MTHVRATLVYALLHAGVYARLYARRRRVDVVATLRPRWRVVRRRTLQRPPTSTQPGHPCRVGKSSTGLPGWDRHKARSRVSGGS